MTYEAIVDGRMSGYVAGDTHEAAMIEAKRLWPTHTIELKEKKADKFKAFAELVADSRPDAISVEDGSVAFWWEDDCTVNHFTWIEATGEWSRGSIYTMEDFEQWNDVVDEDEAAELI